MNWILFFISCLAITNTNSQSISRLSSSCSVSVCGSSTGGAGGSCSGSTPCYRFQSSNETLCAPQVQCSMFDACTTGNRCATNNSICVINSCCLQAICMPRALASACVATNSSGSVTSAPYATSTPAPPTGGVAIDNPPIPQPLLSASIRLCSNATWNSNYTIISGAWGVYGDNETTFSGASDLFLDGNNSVYVADNGNYRIQKFNQSSAVGLTVARTFPWQPIALYVDRVGTIYSCEVAYGVLPYGRLQKYQQGNLYGITLLGGVGNCGVGLNQLCGCRGIFVDQQGLLYISDAPNGRILLYNTTAGMVTVVAGTNGVPGILPGQIYQPQSIYVDQNQNLFVIEYMYGRLQEFTPGNTIGTVIGIGNSYWSYNTGVMGDSLGVLYFAGSYVGRMIPGVQNVTVVFNETVGNGYSSYFTGIRFDTNGALYTLSNNVLIKINLLSNTC